LSVSDADLLGANAAVLTGTLIFLTINSVEGISGIPYAYLVGPIIIIFGMSEIMLVRDRGRTARRLSISGFIVLLFVFSLISIGSIYGGPLYSTSEKCAKNPNLYNVTHPYDCAKFTPGSIAERCVKNPREYNLPNIAACSRFISPT
jgi:hypothetical protein